MTNNYSKSTINNERFFEKIVFDQNYLDVPVIMSRICGSNSTVNNITAVRAIENACHIIPSRQTEKLRELLLYAQIIQSHVLYLYLEVLPDFTGASTISELQKKHQEIFGNALCLKNFADSILESIGGRSIHPIANIPGGFTSYPAMEKLKNIITASTDAIGAATKTLSLFASFDYPELESECILAAIHQPGEYPASGDGVWTNTGKHFVISKYHEHLLKELHPNSAIKHCTLNGEKTMIGPLARLALNKIDNKDLLTHIAELNIDLNFQNPFKNIIASAIETCYFTRKATNIIHNLIDNGISNEPIKLPLKFGTGTACCEAPDGTLIHSYGLNNKGNITSCDIVTPSMINISPLEASTESLNIITKKYSQDEKDRIAKLLLKSFRLCNACGSR